MLEALFVNLAGTWDIHRTITGTPMSGIFTGTAIFKQANSTTLNYCEQGYFCSHAEPHKSIATSKQYCYQWLPQEQTIAVFFADHVTSGQLFHTLQFDPMPSLRATAIHHCGADTYNSTYEFTYSPCFSFAVQHFVEGPTKSYCSTTLFQKNLS